MAVAIYGRISRDPSGKRAGVERQEADCRALCDLRGWHVGDVYIDNDLSAYTGKRRPEYERLCADLEAGRWTHVVAWHPDRLHRRPLELEAFIALIENTGVQVATVQSGSWDLSQPSGRLNARLLGSVARYESEHKSDRVRSKLDQNMKDGKPHGGLRPYGYASDMVTIIPEEQSVVHDMARDVLAWRSLRTIAADLNSAEVPTVSGAPWSPTVVRAILTNPRTAGYRATGAWNEKAKRKRGRGTIVGDAIWQPLLDRDTWHAVRAFLESPERRDTQSTARVHLLSNLAVCATCEVGLLPHHTLRRGQPSISYICRQCRKVAIRKHLLEDYVTEAALLRLEGFTVPAEQPGDDTTIAEQLTALRARRDQTAEAFADDDDVTPDMLKMQLRRFTVRITELEQQQAQARGGAVLAALSGADVRTIWAEADLSRRRAILDSVFTRIAVRPAGGRKLPVGERVELGYR